MQKVKVKINKKTGERTFEIEGVEGNSCDQITEVIEASNEVVEKQYTAEYDNPETLPEYLEEGE